VFDPITLVYSQNAKGTVRPVRNLSTYGGSCYSLR